MRQTKANTKGRKVGAYVRWEPDNTRAQLSYDYKIPWGSVGVIVTPGIPPFKGGNSMVDFDHGRTMLNFKHVFWCRTTDLRVITYREYAIFTAEAALGLTTVNEGD